jgi:hypothetical protein
MLNDEEARKIKERLRKTAEEADKRLALEKAQTRYRKHSDRKHRKSGGGTHRSIRTVPGGGADGNGGR